VRLKEQRQSGSPPLAWGTHLHVAAGSQLGRFTPTRVGNTIAHLVRGPAPPVHPHSRGEHVLPVDRTAGTTGSPPLAWGTHRPHVLSLLLLRFTPTRVGNTCSGRSRRPPRSVHPHSRGEHAVPGGVALAHYGSPPLAWGTRRRGRYRPLERRFTPTRVGNTRHGGLVALVMLVHPHSRGEHVANTSPSNRTAGSPPLAWGTHAQPAHAQRGGRFTPTRVGNTRCSNVLT